MGVVARHATTDAPWSTKLGALATAKLASRLGSLPAEPNDDDLAQLVLHAGATRSEDEFIEAHLWGPVHRSAVEEVRVAVPPTAPLDQVLLGAAYEATLERGIPWLGFPNPS